MRQHNIKIHERDVVIWVNVSLAGVILLLLFYYVMIANSIASKNYRTQILQDKIESLTEINSILMSKKLILENPATLLSFAHVQQLVEVKNVSYIFEGKNVAQR
ncbi:MAG: hypothetical protein A2817_01695 [Candidatus Yanofskybacteria bacterium RIFCSPHIGHO2_01_FULL_39_8b]|uniref:Uncharacterized protein n=1 Tax=Candidatus Yanofskybacteria bacterium RIFCSPHIGHO2_01_FULL_39_8b TaxID=1802659 RepID=A0A1F8EDY4_9BACT|nr:MAG: hypothetical protein A2817_01695 [Candidatus Yanofskybacteria bacterium RIFCSPHIGHO2_01_FULL_39_8b]